MSTAMHTPAPWWVTDYGVRDRGGYICHTQPPTHFPDQDERFANEVEERKANARLIAAAPDLLQELRNIANADTAEWDDRTEFEAWAKNRARYAIAKAVQP